MPITTGFSAVFSTLTLSVCLCLASLLPGCSNDDTSVNSQEQNTSISAAGRSEQIPLGRLSQEVLPLHYNLALTIIPEDTHFSGHAEIDIQLHKETDLIWLHGNNLDVSSVRLAGSDETLIANYEQVDPIGVAAVRFNKVIKSGKIKLIFDYTAPFNDSLEGLYKVSENDRDYAFTQFAFTSARLVFPSFDEPAFKVPFDINLTVANDDVAIANTPVVEETKQGNGQKRLRFATTKPLPTYLVAFAVGDLDVVEWEAIPASDLRQQPVPLRGITVKDKGEQISYALQHTANTVLGLENYFDTAYPYAKLDLIAIPDFPFYAMENAGAITYREQFLLMDEDASVKQKRNYFMVNAHEIAHQWFGNLVTPEWWNDIWLNEAFAEWMAYTILDRLYPGEGYRSELLNNSYDAMALDSLASTRQIRQPIEKHTDISSALDAITYLKGGGVLTMFEGFLGAENFQKGIQHYMKKHAFGNTTAEDFIGAIAEANPQAGDIKSAFMSFLEQPGIPYLNVEQRCSESGPALIVKQQRYAPLGSKAETRQQWQVPACFVYGINGERQEHCTLLTQVATHTSLPGEFCPEYIAPNSGGSSYYRWSLPEKDWQTLIRNIHALGDIEQLSLVNSFSAAFHAGSIDTKTYMQALPNLVNKTFWRAAIAPLDDLHLIINQFVDGEARDKAKEVIRKIYRRHLETIGLEGGDTDTIQLRNELAHVLALETGDAKLRSYLLELGKQAVGFEGDQQLHLDSVDPNLRNTAFKVAIEELGKHYAELLKQHLAHSDNALLRTQLLHSLGWSTDPEIADWSRNSILSPEIKDNEIYYLIVSQMEHHETRDEMWQWMQTNYASLVARFPSWRKGHISKLIEGYCDVEKHDEIESFLATRVNTLEGGPRSLAQTLEDIELCAALKAEQTASAELFFTIN